MVVGNGNVALDVARMLVLGGDVLRTTDAADHAIDALERSSVREVVVLGRRGPAQAAFTNPELRELAQLPDVDVVIEPADLATMDPGGLALTASGPVARRNVELLRELAGRPISTEAKRIVLRFLSSPAEIVGEGRVQGVRLTRNELSERDGRVSTSPVDGSELLRTGLVLRSIGYVGVPLLGVPFDAGRGVISNAGGRVVSPDGEPVRGTYTAGWIKRGASGVIGTNKKCAYETVDLLLEDLAGGTLPPPVRNPDAITAALTRRGVAVVDYTGWELIDAHERARGQAGGRPRVKLVHRADHLLHAHGAATRGPAT